MSEWQPISTAPKDGTDVLAYQGFEGLQDGKAIHRILAMRYDAGVWRTNIHSYVRFEPTHWQPLPPPPVVKGDQPA